MVVFIPVFRYQHECQDVWVSRQLLSLPTFGARATLVTAAAAPDAIRARALTARGR